MKQKKHSPRRYCLAAMFVLLLAAFAVSAVRDGDARIWFLTAAVPVIFLLSATLFARIFSFDRFLAPFSLFLLALGILVLLPDHPDLAMTQALKSAGALAFLFAGHMISRIFRPSGFTVSFSAGIAFMLLLLPLVFGSLPFRAFDLAVVILLIAYAALLDIHNPLMAVLMALVGEAAFLVLHEPVTALIWSAVFLLLLWADSSYPAILFSASAAAALLAYGASVFIPDLFSEKASSVLSGFPPFSLFGLESPASSLDPAMAESSMLLLLISRFGIVFSACVVLFVILFLLRCSSLARAARCRFHAVTAMGCGIIFALTGTASLFSMSGICPFQSVPMPLLTSDFSSLAASLFSIGFLCGIAAGNRDDLDEDTHLAMLAG